MYVFKYFYLDFTLTKQSTGGDLEIRPFCDFVSLFFFFLSLFVDCIHFLSSTFIVPDLCVCVCARVFYFTWYMQF